MKNMSKLSKEEKAAVKREAALSRQIIKVIRGKI